MTHFIEVKNNFEVTRRDILVRRKSLEGTMEEQRASFPSYEVGAEERKKVSFSLGAAAGEEDYLEISVDNRQEELGPCRINISSIGPVTFIPPAGVSVTVIPPGDVENLETNISLRIPSGLPIWKLEIMKPAESSREGSQTNVTLGDDRPGDWV